MAAELIGFSLVNVWASTSSAALHIYSVAAMAIWNPQQQIERLILLPDAAAQCGNSANWLSGTEVRHRYNIKTSGYSMLTLGHISLKLINETFCAEPGKSTDRRLWEAAIMCDSVIKAKFHLSRDSNRKAVGECWQTVEQASKGAIP